jgi:predicted GIY-YIG superfamily endonuclease
MEPIYEFYNDTFTTRKDMKRHCKKVIIKLKGRKHFYIGVTNDPKRRLPEDYEKHNMKTMYVLTKTHNIKQAEKLEQELIKLFSTKLNVNQAGGGEGIKYDEMYVYVLFK